MREGGQARRRRQHSQRTQGGPGPVQDGRGARDRYEGGGAQGRQACGAGGGGIGAVGMHTPTDMHTSSTIAFLHANSSTALLLLQYNMMHTTRVVLYMHTIKVLH